MHGFFVSGEKNNVPFCIGQMALHRSPMQNSPFLPYKASLKLEKKMWRGGCLVRQSFLKVSIWAFVDISDFYMVSGEEDVYAKNQTELGKGLNATRKSVGRWMREKGNPGKVKGKGYNLTLWKMWIEQQGKAPRAVVPQTKSELDAERVRLQNEKLSIEIAKTRGELATWDEVNNTLTQMMSKFVTNMRAMKHQIAADVVGVDVGEASKRIGRSVDENLTELSLGEWAEKKTFWSRVYAHQQDLLERFDLGNGQSAT